MAIFIVNKLQQLFTFRNKKSSLYYMVATTILCSLFYLLGGGFSGSPNPLFSVTNCNVTGSYVKASSRPLDFSSHHSADEILGRNLSGKAVTYFPLCEPSLSEYTPCEDVNRSLNFKRERLIYRERHCPSETELLRCRIPAPKGWKPPFRWPESRDSVWYVNVPHKHLTVEKAGQNWVRFKGDKFSFPGGGTMFPNGAGAYIDDIGKVIGNGLRDGSVRTAIDTGCGVASWGAYLLSRNITAVSFAPKDTHEAQVQFALERGIPALIGVLASIRLPYPARAFDMAHCSRCLIPWAADDGAFLIELDRLLRPGGYWVLSGPPINWERHWKGWGRTADDLKAEQDGIERIAKSLCWKKISHKGDIAIWQKPTNHVHCKINRKVFKKPSFCQEQNPDDGWYTKMKNCLTPLPEVSNVKEIAGGPLAKWPERLTVTPPRIVSGSLKGITAELFNINSELWKKRVARYKTYDYQLAEKGRYRNLLDMNAYLGGFAAALVDDQVWVMNVVPVKAKLNTLGVIYERGLIGTYQNWCEAMSTYPRTYDFIHADSIFSLYKDRCGMEYILLEMDRILRPESSVIIRDDVDVLTDVKDIINGLEWESRLVDSESGPHHREKILFAVKPNQGSKKDS